MPSQTRPVTGRPGPICLLDDAKPRAPSTAFMSRGCCGCCEVLAAVSTCCRAGSGRGILFLLQRLQYRFRPFPTPFDSRRCLYSAVENGQPWPSRPLHSSPSPAASDLYDRHDGALSQRPSAQAQPCRYGRGSRRRHLDSFKFGRKKTLSP